MRAQLITVLLCSTFLVGCVKRDSVEIVGIKPNDFGTVGIDLPACDIPKGYTYMSPQVLDIYVDAKIDQ